VGADHHGIPGTLQPPREGKISEVLRQLLDELQASLDKRQWARCFAVIRKLKRNTTAASESGFAFLLDDPAVDGPGARIASWFLPPLRKLRKQRAELRQPLRLETEYHLAIADFLTFEQTGLAKAWQRALKLRENRLRRRALSGSERDLQLLTLALEVNALSRLAEQVGYGTDDRNCISYESIEGFTRSLNPSVELFVTALNWRSKPEKKLIPRTVPAEVRAAVKTALGLIVRQDRREKSKQKRRSFQSSPEEMVYEEMHHYQASIDLHETSTTHCYLAECLIDMGLRDEANAHVKQALLLAPMNKLAGKLSDEVLAPAAL
jgi:hypothetical protein